MTDPVKGFPDRVPSPCVGVCQMDSTGTLCLGCLRTLPEIVDWSRRTDDEKRAIWAQVRAREAHRKPVR